MPSMMRIALPALAAASTAVAASCSVSATTTIQNAGDATGIASCSTFSGNIAIATGTTDDIDLSGLKKISGDLIAEDNSDMKRISGGDLEELDGEMRLSGLTRLFAVDFPQLKTIKSIKWNALPNLEAIGFTSEVTSAKKVRIENTALRSLKGINIEEVDDVFIANNGYIDEISMQLGNVTGNFSLADNNEAVKVQLPNLIWANNLDFRFCGSVDVPSLQSLNGTLGLYNNGFESFAAPNLTTVGQAIAFIANEKLSNVSFPQLTKISDDLQIANNSKLMDVDGFPQLKKIGGAFDMTGNFTNVSTPELESVKGTFRLRSTGDIDSDCKTYKSIKKLTEGKFSCKGAVADPDSKSNDKKDGSDTDSTGAASTLNAVNGAFGLAAMAAVLLL